MRSTSAIVFLLSLISVALAQDNMYIGRVSKEFAPDVKISISYIFLLQVTWPVKKLNV